MANLLYSLTHLAMVMILLRSSKCRTLVSLSLVQDRSTIYLDCQKVRNYAFVGFYKDSSNTAVKSGGRYSITNFSGGKTLEIRKAEESDEGRYACRVKSGSNVESDSVTLSLRNLAAFAVISSPTYLLKGKLGVISVSLRGKPAKTVTWKRQNRVLVSANYGKNAANGRYNITSTGALLISNVQTSDHGGGYCLSIQPSRFVGECTFATVPAYAEIGASVSMMIGNKGVIQITIRRSPVAKINWTRKVGMVFNPLISGPLGKLSTKDTYSITTSGSLEISSVKASDAGEYCVRLEPGDFKGCTQVRIKGALALQSQTNLIAGKTGIIAVISGGENVQKIRWSLKTKDGHHKLLIAGTFGVLSTNGTYSLTPNGSLIISIFRSADQGMYCVETEPGNVMTCSVVSVITGDKPVLMASPAPIFAVKLHQRFVLTCVFKNINPQIVEWKYSDKTTATTGSLIITAAERKHEVNYTCSATNRFGTTAATFQLKYVIETAVVSSTKIIQAELSKVVRLTCTSRGHPSPTWKWFKQADGNKYSPLPNQPVPSDTTTYSIPSAKISDAGLYKCVAHQGFLIDGTRVDSEAASRLIIYETCNSRQPQNSCPTNSQCYDIKYGFRCRCLPGYVKNNKQCLTGRIFEIKEIIFDDGWRPEYSDASSEIYLMKVKQYEVLLAAKCKSDGCLGVRVNRLTQGSVKVKFSIIFGLEANVDIKTIEAYLNRLKNLSTPSITIPDSDPTSSAIESNVCDANGKSCGINSRCVLINGGVGFTCKCDDGAVDQGNGKCSTEEEGSSNTAAIVVPICVIVVIGCLVLVLVLLRNKRNRQFAKTSSERKFDVRNSVIDTMPNNYDVIAGETRGKKKDQFNNPSYTNPEKVKNNLDLHTNIGEYVEIEKKVENEPVYALYAQSDEYSKSNLSNVNDNPGFDGKEPVYEIYEDSSNTRKEPIYEVYGNNERTESSNYYEPTYALYDSK